MNRRTDERKEQKQRENNKREKNKGLKKETRITPLPLKKKKKIQAGKEICQGSAFWVPPFERTSIRGKI